MAKRPTEMGAGQQLGSFIPSELIFQALIPDESKDATDETQGGSVTYPEPVFPWTTGSGLTDDEETQNLINAAVRVPIGTDAIKVMWRKVKRNGEYGPKHHSEVELDETQSNAGYWEGQLFGGDAPFPSNKRVDVLRLIAVMDGPNPRYPADPTLIPTVPPAAVPGQATGTGVSNPPAVATVLFGDFVPGTLFIRSVGTAVKEKGAIEVTVLVGISRNVEWVRLSYARVGTKTDANAYRKTKRSDTVETTKQQRDDTTYGDGYGTVAITLHELKPYATYDILRIAGAATIFNDNDEATADTKRFRVPADPLAVSTFPGDTDPNNDGAGHAYLARFSTGAEIDASPNPPRGSDIVKNEPDFDTEKADAIIGLRVWADDSDHAKTFAQVFATRVFVQVAPQATLSNVHVFDRVLDLDQQNETNHVIYFHRQIGRKMRWLACGLSNASDRVKVTPVSPVDFQAGRGTTDTTLISGFDIDLYNFTPEDNRRLKAEINWTSTAGPADPDGSFPFPIPRKIRIYESEGASDASYHVELPDRLKGDKDDAGVDLAASGYHALTYTVKRPAGSERYYKAGMLIVGSSTEIMTAAKPSTSASDPSGVGDLPIRSDLNGPSSPSTSHAVRNHILGDPASATVDFVYTPYMDGTDADQTFGAPDATYGPVRDITLVFQPRNAANTADVGRKRRVSVKAALEKGSLAAPFEMLVPGFDPGHRYRLVEIRYTNGAGSVIRDGGFADFVAGALSYSFDATTIGAATPTYTQDDNRHSIVSLTITQPALPVLLKSATYEVSYDDGSTWKHRKTRHLLGKATRYSVTGSVTLIETIQHRKNISQMRIRVILTPLGAEYETGDTVAAPHQAFTSASQAVSDDPSAGGVPNPAGVAAAPTFKKAFIGTGGLSARFAKPSDSRPYLQYYEFQFADSSSVTTSVARDWLNAEDGTAAYTSVAPNTDTDNAAATNLANATFTAGNGRFQSNDLNKRDLAVTFKSGSANGTLSLYVRARIVDTTDAGALRYGNWSTWNAVVFKSQRDRNHDAPLRHQNTGRVNYLEGGSCTIASNQFPNPPVDAGPNKLGKEFRLGRGASANLIATYASDYASGNRWDAGRKGIYWEKPLRAISMYGNAPTTGNQINARLYGHIVASQVMWICFAIRSDADRTFANGFTIGVWDTVLNNWLNSGGLVTGSMDLTSTWKLFVGRLALGTTAPTPGAIMVSISPGSWGALTTSVPMYFTNLILSAGPEPKTLFEPGVQEARINATTSAGEVSMGDANGLAALYNTGGLGNDSISSWGFLDLT